MFARVALCSRSLSGKSIGYEITGLCYQQIFFMKLFNTNVMDTVRFCQDLFGFELPSVLIMKRKVKFVDKFEQFTNNCFALD